MENPLMRWWEAKLNQIANVYAELAFHRAHGRDFDLGDMDKIKLVAHRGAWGRSFQGQQTIENTLSAFELARQNNIWGIEFDVRWTKDLVPVVHHDARLGRVLGPPHLAIADLTAIELKKAAPDLPTLREVVETFGGPDKMHLMVELKEPLVRHPQQLEILKDIFKPFQPARDFHFMTLDPQQLAKTSFLDPKAILSIAWMNTAQVVKTSIELGIGGATGHFALLTPMLRQHLRAHGLGVGTGFIQTRGCLCREVQRGTNWLFTNTPLELKAFLKPRSP